MEGPCLFIAREGKGGQQRRLRVNWRDHRNISSFYFTRFPEDTTEDELWKIFRRAGDVREVFIPNKRNRTGRRYGFVRFIGVDNVQQLERRLDNIVMGGLKLYVNIPKFERGRGRVQPQSTGGREHTRLVEQGRRETYQAQKHTATPGLVRGSFADVVARREPRIQQRRTSAVQNAKTNTSRSEVHLDRPMTAPKWLQDAWVGRLKNLALLDRVEENMLWDWGLDVVPKYIGDDMVLLPGLTEDKAKQMMEEGNAGREVMFYSVERWNKKMRAGSRLTWVQCWGVPLVAWDPTHLREIVTAIGEVVEVDEEMEDLRKMDRARLLVRTPWKPLIQHTVSVHIETEVFQVHIIEESGSSPNWCHCRRSTMLSSSEDICSEESEMVSLSELMTAKPQSGSQKVEMVEERRVTSEADTAPEEDNGMQGPTASTSIQLLSNGRITTSEPLDNNLDWGIEEESRCRVGGESNGATKSQMGTYGEARAAVGAVTRCDSGVERIIGAINPVGKGKAKHEQGNKKEGGSGTDVEHINIHSAVACDMAHYNCGLDFTTHTPPKFLTHQVDYNLKAQSAQTPPFSVYFRKKWRKKQSNENGPQMTSGEVVEQGKRVTQQESNKEAHEQSNNWQADPDNIEVNRECMSQQNEIQDTNITKEAETLWQMTRELGVTCHKEKMDQVQQLIAMEERDIKESESLGGMRKSQ